MAIFQWQTVRFLPCQVNGIRGNVALMLEKCKADPTLELTICKCLTFGHLVADLE
jgi:hypothetical protein